MTEIFERIADLPLNKRKLLELLISDAGNVDNEQSKDCIPQRGGDRAPLSFAQQRLWFLNQLSPGSSSYNVFNPLRIEGRLSVEVLEQVLNEIMRRHQILRASFAFIEDQPAQFVDPDGRLNLLFTDLSSLSEAEREAEVLELARQEAQRPFDLTTGPLLRVSLLRFGESEHVALFTMHHIISDAWSMGLLVGEVSTLYEAFLSGVPSPLAELVIQYQDFSWWQRSRLKDEKLNNLLGYWRKQLMGAPLILELPTDFPRPPLESFRGEIKSLMLPVSLSDDLKELSRRERVTLFMTLLAAFKVLLHYYTDRTDIIVGTDVANRNRAEVEKLIGFFVNQLVLRVSLKDDPTFRRLLERVRDVTLAAYAHQELPFNMLVDALKPKRDLSRNPLFQVMFSFQNVPKGSLRMPGLTMNSLKVETVTSIFDLSLYVSDTGEGLMECFRYNTDLFRPSTADRMLSHFEAILQFVVEQPDARLSELRKILATADLQRRIKEQGEIEKSNLVKLRKVRRKMISQ